MNSRSAIALVALFTIPNLALAQPAPSPAPATNASAAQPAAQTAPANGTTVDVAGGTPISVSVTQTVSSSNANVNDTVPITVNKEVDVNGYVVIAKGANGQATVSSVDRAGGNGHGGKLALTVDWVYSVDGGKIALSNVNHASDENGDNKGASSTATIATYVLLGPLGLFAHNFVRGRDVSIQPTTAINVFVDKDVHVVASTKASTAAGFDH